LKPRPVSQGSGDVLMKTNGCLSTAATI
jgi:hypothetical protein